MKGKKFKDFDVHVDVTCGYEDMAVFCFFFVFFMLCQLELLTNAITKVSFWLSKLVRLLHDDRSVLLRPTVQYIVVLC